jgi:hypothetical protein
LKQFAALDPRLVCALNQQILHNNVKQHRVHGDRLLPLECAQPPRDKRARNVPRECAKQPAVASGLFQ